MKFKVGDTVRINQNYFDKLPNERAEYYRINEFKIIGIDKNKFPIRVLMDVKQEHTGRFSENELDLIE